MKKQANALEISPGQEHVQAQLSSHITSPFLQKAALVVSSRPNPNGSALQEEEQANNPPVTGGARC